MCSEAAVLQPSLAFFTLPVPYSGSSCRAWSTTSSSPRPTWACWACWARWRPSGWWTTASLAARTPTSPPTTSPCWPSWSYTHPCPPSTAYTWPSTGSADPTPPPPPQLLPTNPSLCSVPPHLPITPFCWQYHPNPTTEQPYHQKLSHTHLLCGSEVICLLLLPLFAQDCNFFPFGEGKKKIKCLIPN